MQFLYFAYGSNLLTQRLRARTASATALGWGVLPGHALRWHMASSDGSGKCDVVEDVQVRDPVHGVVYKIDSAEKPLLDRAESLGVGYRDEQVTVHVGFEPMRVWLYKALQVDADAVPYDWYHALVLGGAREHRLPAAYLRALETVQTRTDPDPRRSALHFALTRSVG